MTITCDHRGVVTIQLTACVDAPAANVWACLARLESIEQWSEAVVRARCDGARTRGVGAERTCELRGRVTIRERWLAWDEGRSYTYEGSGIPLVAHARNTWTVAAVGDATLLTSRAEVLLRGGPLGRLLEPLIAAQSRRMGRRALAAIGYLASHGEAPAAPHRSLAALPSAC